MITALENKEIHKFLNSRNLPLDLKLEILDHVTEQIIYKMDFEAKDFTTAFSEIIETWREDLQLSKPFYKAFGKSKILKETVLRSNLAILKKTFFYFGIYFSITLILLSLNNYFAYYFVFCSFILMIGIYFYNLIFDCKTYIPSSKNKELFISYLQSGSKLFGFASFFLLFKLYNFDYRISDYFERINSINFSNFFNYKIYLYIISYNLLFLLWVFGFLHYLQYKKAFKKLKQRINFNI